MMLQKYAILKDNLFFQIIIRNSWLAKEKGIIWRLSELRPYILNMGN